MIKLLVLFTLLVSVAFSQQILDTLQGRYGANVSTVLNPQNNTAKVNCYVYYQFRQEVVHLAVACNLQVQRYVGFGFSDTGLMIQSYGYINMNNTLREYFFIQRELAAFQVKPVASAYNISFQYVNNYKVVEFTRRLNTGDRDQKVIDPFQETNLILSCANADNQGTLEFHEEYRSQVKLNFLNCANYCNLQHGSCNAQTKACICNAGYWGPTCDLQVNEANGNLTGYKYSARFLGNQYTLYWTPPTVLDENSTISFAIEAKTIGYIGFGFSNDGNMVGSDAVIGWISPFGVESVNSYRLGDKNPMFVTLHPNLTLYNTSAYEYNGATIIKFTRKVFSGNVDITSNTTKFIAAIGEGDVVAEHLVNKRVGSITLTLFQIIPTAPTTTNGATSIVLTMFHFVLVLLFHRL